MIIRWPLFCYILSIAVAQDDNCDYYQRVSPTNTYPLKSPYYPQNYTGAFQCRWIADCPDDYNCRLDCPEILLPQSTSCRLDRLLVSRSGDPQLSGAEKYCGRGSLSIVSTGQRLSLGLITDEETPGGRFSCSVSAQRSTPGTQCRCGERRQNRIVGGQETGVNEYKMMAGIVDVQISQIKCGAVIISNRHVLTAAHCVMDKGLNDIAVVVGEHNVKSDDLPARQVFRVSKILIHDRFTESNYDYDIAILTVDSTIEFNDRVGPVCLPFKFARNNPNWLTGKKVTDLGWGTTSFGGVKSNVLLKVDLDVISQNECQSKIPSLTRNQICTLSPRKDACQDDSGGPALYTDPDTGLLFNVGIISYGRSCASGDPGINTRVTSFLDWIVSNTRTNFCVK